MANGANIINYLHGIVAKRCQYRQAQKTTKDRVTVSISFIKFAVKDFNYQNIELDENYLIKIYKFAKRKTVVPEYENRKEFIKN